MRKLKPLLLVSLLILLVSVGVSAHDNSDAGEGEVTWGSFSNLEMNEEESSFTILNVGTQCRFKAIGCISSYTDNCGYEGSSDFDGSDISDYATSLVVQSVNDADISCWITGSSTLKCTDSGTANNQFEVTLRASGNYAYDSHSDDAWFHDDCSGDTANYYFDTKTITVDITQVNDNPTSESFSITTLRGTEVAINATDFPFDDEEDSEMTYPTAVQIKSQYNTNKGQLLFSGAPVYDNQIVQHEDLIAGHLTYTPSQSISQLSATQIFNFKVIDSNAAYSDTHQAKIIISYVDNPPVFDPLPKCGNKNLATTGVFTGSGEDGCPLREDFSSFGTNMGIQLNLKPYCQDDNAELSISDETNPNIIDCYIPTSGSFKNYLQCTSINNAFGTNIITIDCFDTINAVASQDIEMIINNEYDDAYISNQNFAIGLSPGTSRIFPLPIVNPDRKNNLNLIDAIPSTLGSTEYVFNSETETYDLNFTAGDYVGTQTGVMKYRFYNPGTVTPVVGDITVTIDAVNQPPHCENTAISSRHIAEDGEYFFKSTDFSNTCGDPEGLAIANIVVRSFVLPSKGNLTFNGNLVHVGQSIPTTQIHNLKFTPKSDGNGESYTSFQFSGTDGVLWSTPVSMVLNVRGINDDPTIENPGDQTGNNSFFEDIENRVTIFLDDIDGDDLGIIIDTSDHGLINPSSIEVAGSGYIKDLIITPEPNQYGGPITIWIEVLDMDGNRRIGGSNEIEFQVEVTGTNDKPTTQDFEKEAYVYGTIYFDAADFAFEDYDDEDLFSSIKVYNPILGSLFFDGTSIVGSQEIEVADINKLTFELPPGKTNTTGIKFIFTVSDGEENSEVHNATMKILPSPFGDLSQPRSRGGVRILQTDWSCKPGYTPDSSGFTMQTIFEAGEVCVKMENELPTADLVAPEIVQIGDVAFFSAGRSADPDGIIKEYAWELSPNVTKTGEKVHHIYNSIDDCTSGICNIQLTVTDSDGGNTTANTTLTLTTDEIDGADYYGLTMIEGQNYTDDELTYLGLLKGQMNLKGDEEVTVDTTGMITSIEEQIVEVTGEGLGYESYSPNDGQCQTGERESSTPLDCLVGDGICSESLGEHSLNSPDDCKGNSKMGAVLLLAFLTLLGGGVFFAWKKGLLGKHNLSLGAKPTADASPFETTQPIQSEQPVGPESYIKTQRAKGFSNEQIRGALKNKGWSDDKIDEALNASRE